MIEKFDADTWMTQLLANAGKAEENVMNERPTVEQVLAQEAATVVAASGTEPEPALEREIAAENAVNLVMRQLGLAYPTMLSKWTMLEVARLLHALHQAPGEMIGLGVNHEPVRALTAGAVKRDLFK